ncbi:MAG: SAVED domain-containing protein [Anaerolineales bacterium]|nr:SAVED domain-containing protein [Anaerolineales bacterium]
MAKSVIARRQGDEYQALFFWTQLMKLLVESSPAVRKVTFESHQRIFVDDVFVEYFEPVLDSSTGQTYQIDAYQCKYHVTQSTTFSLDALLDPTFIGTQQSMLQRLFDAYKRLLDQSKPFRLNVVSSSQWNPGDDFAQFVAAEGHLRTNFYEKGTKSKQGKLREKVITALNISESELKPFLGTVRFDLGKNRSHLLETLNAQLKPAGLVPFDRRITNTRYAELAWKWLEQDSSSFDKDVLQAKVAAEKLIDINKKQLLIIRHQTLDPITPEAIQPYLPHNLQELPIWEVPIDLTDFFQGGHLLEPQQVAREQTKTLSEIKKLLSAPTIEPSYYGIAHVPLVFLSGYQLNIRKPIHLFEHDRSSNRWDLLEQADGFPYPELISNHSARDFTSALDAVIKFGVSYPIQNQDVDRIVSSPRLDYELQMPEPEPDSIRSHEQLEGYARVFRKTLDLIHNTHPTVKRVHVFFAGPVSLAFRCGQLISPTLHPRVFVYNFVFNDDPKYKWAFGINVPTNSPEFFISF